MSAPAKSLPIAKDEKPVTRFDWRKYGTLSFPIHKSHLSTLVGEFACTEQFLYDRKREVDPKAEERKTCSGKTAMGSAAHEAIARALRKEELRDRLLAGGHTMSVEGVTKVVLEEFARETEGLEVIWYGKAERESVLESIVAMTQGLLNDIHKHVAAVELVEAGFIAQIGEYWTEGHVDLAYRPKANPEQLGLTDWKTGATKPHQIVLDHGWESGFYANALQCGIFVRTDTVELWRKLVAHGESVPLENFEQTALATAPNDREAMHIVLRSMARKRERGESLPEEVVQPARFPDEIRLTHLADYVPYQKKGKKSVERPEEVEFWGLPEAGEVKYEAGQQRGPAWYRVRRTADDLPRLEHLLRGVVGWVRFGRFVKSVSEKCTRCSYRAECLTSGYEARGEEAKQLAGMLKNVEFDGFADND